MTRAQRPLVIALLGILAALIVVLAVLVVVILQSPNGGETTLARGTATPTLTPTPVLNISPAQGWVETHPKLPFARTVAFGTNDPLSGYACGSQSVQMGFSAQNKQPVALQFSRTTDGGRTWQAPHALSFGQGYATCELHIDPADAKDVVLGRIAGCDVGPCDGDTSLVFDWYRSRDGGQTWSHLTYPTSLAQAAAAKGYFLFDKFAWDSTTLYAAVSAACLGACLPGPPNAILVSKNGGAFATLPSAPLSTALAAPYTAFVTPVFWVNGTMNVLFIYQSSGAWGQAGALGGVTSRDGGQSWTTFTSMCNGAAAHIALELQATTQGTLVGACTDKYTSNGAATLVQSTDGQTWTALPAQPPGDFALSAPFFVTPDGALYVATTGAQGGIMRLSESATTWQMLNPYSTQSPSHTLTAVSWDVAGHTVALWGAVITTEKAPSGFPGASEIPTSFGLAYHAAAPGQ